MSTVNDDLWWEVVRRDRRRDCHLVRLDLGRHQLIFLGHIATQDTAMIALLGRVSLRVVVAL